jgi:hypothetical protein
MTRFSSWSKKGNTGVTMPYVKPSVNNAVHIVTIMRAFELLKPETRKENFIVSEKRKTVDIRYQEKEAICYSKPEVQVEIHMSIF